MLGRAGLVCAAVLAVAAVLAACTGADEDEPRASQRVTSTSPQPGTETGTDMSKDSSEAAGAETEPAETAAPAARRPGRPRVVSIGRVRPVSRPASRAELRWLGSYSVWWREFSTDIERMLRASDKVVAGELDAEREERLYEILDRLRQCETELSRRIAYPRSERLRRLYALLTDACFAIEATGANAARVLVHGADADAVDSWRAEWEDAERLLREAFRRVSAFDPALARSLPRTGGVTEASRVEPRLGRAAHAVAGKRVTVRCWSRDDWRALVRDMGRYTGGQVTARNAGFATVGGDQIDLHPDVCAWLVGLVYLDERPSAGRDLLAMAFSVNTLSHESEHARGVADEAAAECYGLQDMTRLAKPLGIERPYVTTLAQHYWRRGYRLGAAHYRSPECRNGKDLDLRLGRDRWP